MHPAVQLIVSSCGPKARGTHCDLGNARAPAPPMNSADPASTRPFFYKPVDRALSLPTRIAEVPGAAQRGVPAAEGITHALGVFRITRSWLSICLPIYRPVWAGVRMDQTRLRLGLTHLRGLPTPAAFRRIAHPD